MRTMILAAALAAASFAAYADSTSNTRCWHVGRYGERINCESQIETKYSTTTTQCMFGHPGGSACASESVAKPQPKPPEPPKPIKPPSTEIGVGGVRIMRGMPQ